MHDIMEGRLRRGERAEVECWFGKCVLLCKSRHALNADIFAVVLDGDGSTMMVNCSPFPDCAKATRARATKNSRRDTRGLELTRLTIYAVC